MPVSFHKRNELYAERATLKAQLDTLIPKLNAGDDAALESFTALEAKIGEITASIDSANGEIDADLNARHKALEFREAAARAAQLSASEGVGSARARAASRAVDLLAGAAASVSDEAQDRSAAYGAAFGSYLRHGYGGMSGSEKSLIAAHAWSERDLMALRTTDPDLFAVIQSGDDASAGYLIPPGPMATIEKAELAFSGMLEAPTFKFSTADGRTISVPTLDDTSNSGTWLAETGDHSSGTDPAFGTKQIGAHQLSSKIIRVSNVFLQDVGFPFESYLYSLLGERLGRAKNTAFTTGSGVGRPTGVVNSAASGVTAASASAITFNELTDLEHSVNRAYRNRNTCAYMAADATIKAMKKLLDGEGRPLWQIAVAAGQPDTINGWRYVINDDVATMAASAKSVLFGDWSKYFIRTVTGRTIVRLVERYGELNQVGFCVIERTDGLLVAANATTLNPIKYLANA